MVARVSKLLPLSRHCAKKTCPYGIRPKSDMLHLPAGRQTWPLHRLYVCCPCQHCMMLQYRRTPGRSCRASPSDEILRRQHSLQRSGSHPDCSSTSACLHCHECRTWEELLNLCRPAVRLRKTEPQCSAACTEARTSGTLSQDPLPAVAAVLLAVTKMPTRNRPA